MILVIGGAFQGKRTVCRELLGMGEAEFAGQLADGKTLTMTADEKRTAEDPGEFAKQCMDEVLTHLNEKPCIAAYQEIIRFVMQTGGDPDLFTKKLLDNPPRVVSLDEVGCGIVPMDRAERDYREAVGRSGQMLAKQADEVYRVLCGIPTRIK